MNTCSVLIFRSWNFLLGFKCSCYKPVGALSGYSYLGRKNSRQVDSISSLFLLIFPQNPQSLIFHCKEAQRQRKNTFSVGHQKVCFSYSTLPKNNAPTFYQNQFPDLKVFFRTFFGKNCKTDQRSGATADSGLGWLDICSLQKYSKGIN